MQKQPRELPLSHLRPGEGGWVSRLESSDDVVYALMERGIGPGEYITYVRTAPFGDPIEVELLNYRISLRKDEAEKIILKDVHFPRQSGS